MRPTIIGGNLQSGSPGLPAEQKPTVIGSQPTAVPTTLPAAAPAPAAMPEVRPTVIGSKPTTVQKAPAVPAKQDIQPTVLGSQPAARPVTQEPQRALSAQPTQIPASLPAPAPAVVEPVAPSAIPGARLIPAAVSRSELAQRHPSLDSARLEALAQVLESEAPVRFDTLSCERFGRADQQQHTTLVDRFLRISEQEAMRLVPRHLMRLSELLTDVAEAFEPASALGKLLRKSPQERVNDARVELDQLRDWLQRGGKDLEAIHTELESIYAACDTLEKRADLLALAAEDLSQTQGQADSMSTASRVLQDRAVSLARTQASLQQQLLQLDASRKDCSRLRGIVNDAVLVQLPAWLVNVAAHSSDINETQRYVLRDGLQVVLNQLPKQR